MNKYIVVGALVLAGLAITASAFAATKYGNQFPRAALFAVVEGVKDNQPVYKFTDGATSCYVYGASISCVK